MCVAVWCKFWLSKDSAQFFERSAVRHGDLAQLADDVVKGDQFEGAGRPLMRRKILADCSLRHER